MDRIIIEDLEVYAFHGVALEEKKLGQMFVVSLQINIDLETAAQSGDLDATINYAEVCNVVRDILQLDSCDLIETAALNIIKGVLHNFDNAQAVKVLLKKPWAPMGHHLNYAAVELERQRGDRDEW